MIRHKKKNSFLTRFTIGAVIGIALSLALGICLRPILAETGKVLTAYAKSDVSAEVREVPVPSFSEASANVVVPTEPVQLQTQIQTVNGLEVRATNFRKAGTRVKVDVCFLISDKSKWSDWYVFATTLNYQNGSISDFWEGVIESAPASDGQGWLHCEWLGFHVPSTADLSAFTLTIERIGSIPAEGHECDEWQARLQKDPVVIETDLQVECKQVEGGTERVILNKPDSMTQEMVDALISKAMSGEVSGPWIFTGSLTE